MPYEKSSPIYSLLSGQKVGQIPIDEHKEIDREELLGFQKIISALEWMLLILVLFCAKLPAVTVLQPAALGCIAAAFAVFTGSVQFVGRAYHERRWHLALNTWVIVCFIATAVRQTGGVSSPLQPLCFISIMLSGILLGARTAFLQAAFISVCCIFSTIHEVYSFGETFSLHIEEFGAQCIHLAVLWLVACATALISKETDSTKEKIRQLSRTDQLTGLWNMKMLLIFMQREYQRTLNRTGKFSILMIDADSLKAVNDAHGHHAGTMLIVSISETMRRELREEDMVARFGGDEFIAFLPDTDREEAFAVAEKMRKKIAETPLGYEGHVISITVSCGIACFPDHGDDLTEIMKMADKALYRSKDQGKNRCTIFQPSDAMGRKW